jgi:cyclopropane-fatty-acyl-phospholipid synthase
LPISSAPRVSKGKGAIVSIETTTARPGATLQAIQQHYDVGNEFYRLWLDSSLSYSGAIWQPGDSLDAAQLRKVDYHIAAAQAANAGRVLDIGCGWGAVLHRLVQQAGVGQAVGITLSQAQADWIAQQRWPHTEVRVENWLDHVPAQPYDAIISIGAFEHFAGVEDSDEKRIEGYRAFFRKARSWLRRDGRMSLQTFAYGNLRSREEAHRSAGTRFLASEIFPETDPPRLSDIAVAIDGAFEIELLRNDRKDYARTCMAWLKRLRAARSQAAALVGADVVSRYERYLQLSTLGFETGNLLLLRITLRRID